MDSWPAIQALGEELTEAGPVEGLNQWGDARRQLMRPDVISGIVATGVLLNIDMHNTLLIFFVLSVDEAARGVQSELNVWYFLTI